MTKTMTTRWNRCTTKCGCKDVNKRDEGCTCKGGCERGSVDRRSMQAYALNVLFNLGLWDGKSLTAICPLTGKPFDLAVGEVDKIHAAAGYVPGNVVMVSRQGNQERGKLQEHYGDIAGLARYAANVSRASVGVPVLKGKAVPVYPTVKRTKAAEWLPHEFPTADMRNVRFGPYGRA